MRHFQALVDQQVRTIDTYVHVLTSNAVYEHTNGIWVRHPLDFVGESIYRINDTIVIKGTKNGQIIYKQLDGTVLDDLVQINGLVQTGTGHQGTPWASHQNTHPIPKGYAVQSESKRYPLERVARYVKDDLKFIAHDMHATLLLKDTQLIVQGVDSVSHRCFLFATLENAHGPFTLTASEHFVFVTYQRFFNKRFESVGVMYELMHPIQPTLDFNRDIPIVRSRQVLIEQGPFIASTVSQTTNGMAHRDIICLLNS